MKYETEQQNLQLFVNNGPEHLTVARNSVHSMLTRCARYRMRIARLKPQISAILSDAIGTNKYCTEDGFIRWGRVEREIHGVIDDVLKEDQP